MMNEVLNEGTRRAYANADLRNGIAATTEVVRAHVNRSATLYSKHAVILNVI